MRNEEMNWTENDIENEIELISLVALMITEIEETDWEGMPEITPVSESRDNPWGRDPDSIA